MSIFEQREWLLFKCFFWVGGSIYNQNISQTGKIRYQCHGLCNRGRVR